MTEILGIDVGGVIIDNANDDTDTSFLGGNYLETTAVPEAFAAIRCLVLRRFPSRVYVVSKCGPRIAARTLQWMDHHDFFERTLVPPERVLFCLKRADKATIARDLGITHFIDDRLEVLGHMGTVGCRILFRPEQHEVDQHKEHLPHVHRVESWTQVSMLLDGSNWDRVQEDD